MNFVVSWCVQNVLKRAEISNKRGMDPSLVQQIQLLMSQSLARRDDEGQREIEELKGYEYQ